MCTLEVPPRARSRPRALSRARRSRPRPRRADASFVLCLSLSRSHARDSRVSFRFMSFHSSPAAAVGRRMDALGPLSRGDDEDEDADDAFVRVSSLVWIVVSRLDAQRSNIEMEDDQRVAAARATPIHPSAATDVRGKASGGASEGGTARRGGWIDRAGYGWVR